MTDKNNGEYPPDLKAATRAEYVTMVRMMTKEKKGPGCPLMGSVIILIIVLTLMVVL
jgi:hypothetical protein